LTRIHSVGKLARIGGGARPAAHRRHPLRGALRDRAAAGVAGVGAQVDDVITSAITSRFCSITTTVSPRSASRCSARVSRSTSAMCKPMVGSSRT